VNGEKISAEQILIATGGKPFVPEFKGSQHVITSDDTFYLSELPKRVLIVGGGYIAVEFAGIYNGLGCEVQLSYRGDLILRGFDEEVRHKLSTEIAKKGVNILYNSQIESIDKNSDETLSVHFANGHLQQFDQVLYATGRVPRVAELGLDKLSIKTAANGSIVVNDYFQTSVASIYAIGDVINRVQLTPVALGEAMVLARNLFVHKTPTEIMDYEKIPSAVFSNPNFATVGLTEAEALKAHQHLAIFSSEFRHMKHSLTDSDETVFMKMIVDMDTDKILGIHMIGADAGEMIQGLAVAVKMGATKAQLDSTVGIHPTAAEEFVTMREATREVKA